MTKRLSMVRGLFAMIVGAAALSTAAALQSAALAPAQSAGHENVSPRYGSDGALLLPGDYRQWVFVGSSLGLSYTEGQSGAEMFHETLMEPTAYRHFVETRTFREGTMLALILHGMGENTLPARKGKFANEVHGVELAVKDSSHRPEGWAYYNFGGMTGLRTTAQAMPKESCYSCHAQHAKRDNVFLQFYPLLAEAAHLATATGPGSAANDAGDPGAAPASTPMPAATGTTLALNGLDPILLLDGREEMGKPEIVAPYGPYRYQFVSEPDRARFAADPTRFSIQNTTCPVVRGAPVNPALFAVHEGRIYAFATTDCVKTFKDRPSDFIEGQRSQR